MSTTTMRTLTLDIAANGKPFERGPGLGLLDADPAYRHASDARFGGGNVTLCGRDTSKRDAEMAAARPDAANARVRPTNCPGCLAVMATWSR